MIEKYRGEQPLPKGLSQKDKNKTTNRLGCLILILFGLFWFLVPFPGFLYNWEQRRIGNVTSTAEHIRTALADYAEKHPDHRYPEDIPDYATLHTIVNKHGGSLPDKQSAAAIAQIHYILDYGKGYNLTIEVEAKNKERFLLITPEGVTRHSEIITPSKGYEAKEIAQDSRFIIDNNKMVIDTKTGLMWAYKDNGYDINWNDAKKYCTSYKGGEYSDWRMPTISELSSIHDKSKKNRYGYYVSPLIGISECCVWTSEIRGSDAARFDFHVAIQHWHWASQSSVSNFGRALPVRSSK